VLLLLDEFPQLGKLDDIAGAFETLRSKNVTIAIFIQSLARLDETYGNNIRKIINDNCPYKALLSAGDADTQGYCSILVGDAKFPVRNVSANYGKCGEAKGFSHSMGESWEPIIRPHEFANLPDIVLLHPEGNTHFSRIENLSHIITGRYRERSTGFLPHRQEQLYIGDGCDGF
jgi:type IV secretion system protein VirD4